MYAMRRISRTLLLAGAILAAGAATASDATADQKARAHERQGLVEQKRDAPDQKTETRARDCTCSTGTPGIQLAPPGTDPELDRMRGQG